MLHGIFLHYSTNVLYCFCLIIMTICLESSRSRLLFILPNRHVRVIILDNGDVELGPFFGCISIQIDANIIESKWQTQSKRHLTDHRWKIVIFWFDFRMPEHVLLSTWWIKIVSWACSLSRVNTKKWYSGEKWEINSIIFMFVSCSVDDIRGHWCILA